MFAKNDLITYIPTRLWRGFIVVGAALALLACDNLTPPAPPTSSPGTPAAIVASNDDVIASAVRDQRSGFMVDITGTVQRLLADDEKGSRHQRFIVKLSSGRTLLIAHNIDLAPRIDALKVGDKIELRGQYEWNPRGGVIHWTHHDPDGRHEAGWIRHRDKLYR